MPKRLIVAVVLAALVSAASYSQTFSMETTGPHANKITRDRDAILGFSPVGAWAAPATLSENSPTASYMFVYKEGLIKILNTNCWIEAVGRWEYDDAGYLMIMSGGVRVGSLVVGVPGVRHVDDERNHMYGLGQRVLFDTAQYWDYLSPEVNADDC